MFDIFVNKTLISIEMDKDKAFEKAVELTDAHPEAEIEVLTWEDEELFHSYPTE